MLSSFGFVELNDHLHCQVGSPSRPARHDLTSLAPSQASSTKAKTFLEEFQAMKKRREAELARLKQQEDDIMKEQSEGTDQVSLA